MIEMHSRSIARAQRHRRIVSRCTTRFAQECANFFCRDGTLVGVRDTARQKNPRRSPTLVVGLSRLARCRRDASEADLRLLQRSGQCLRERLEVVGRLGLVGAHQQRIAVLRELLAQRQAGDDLVRDSGSTTSVAGFGSLNATSGMCARLADSGPTPGIAASTSSVTPKRFGCDTTSPVNLPTAALTTVENAVSRQRGGQCPMLDG